MLFAYSKNVNYRCFDLLSSDSEHLRYHGITRLQRNTCDYRLNASGEYLSVVLGLR
jgi:hypothetical protein